MQYIYCNAFYSVSAHFFPFLTFSSRNIRKKTAVKTTAFYLLYIPQNAGSCILTPSTQLGGYPHLLFCLPLRNRWPDILQRYETPV